jgi:hypothetical protein
MNFGKKRIVGNPNKFTESVVNSGKNCENSTHRKYVVEVRNDVVGIVKSDIKACISKNNTSNTANGE